MASLVHGSFQNRWGRWKGTSGVKAQAEDESGNGRNLKLVIPAQHQGRILKILSSLSPCFVSLNC